MKRLLIAAFVLAAFTASVSAQETGPSTLGIKGGLNYVKVRGDNVDDAKYLMGYAFGAFYQYQVNPRFAVSPEIYYTLKGAKQDVTDFEMKLTYIEIPVLLKLTFPTESVATPAVYAGPYLAFLMSADFNDIDIKDTTKGTDYGLVFGAGTDIALSEGKHVINIDIRYTLGLGEVGDDPEETDKMYNNGFQFLVGFGFNL